jgi:hypothetical protein
MLILSPSYRSKDSDGCLSLLQAGRHFDAELCERQCHGNAAALGLDYDGGR